MHNNIDDTGDGSDIGENIMVEAGHAGANAASVAVDGPITRSDVHQVLAFFVSIEPDPEDVDSIEEYQAYMDHYQNQITEGNHILRAYGEQIREKTLSNMREVYYSFTNDGRYTNEPKNIAVVTTVLTRAWNGIGPWMT